MSNPSRRRILSAAVGGAAAWGALGWVKAGQCHQDSATGAVGTSFTESPLVRTTRALGTDVSVTVIHADAPGADRAVRAAFQELQHVEELLSIYRPDSQVGRLNRDGAIDDAHPHLQSVLQASLDMSRRSVGAFDVTVQPLWEVYAAASRDRHRPTDDEVNGARERVDWRRLHVSGARVRLAQAGMAITLNGIAQGYATDRVRAVLEAHGIRQALVDVGELGSIGKKADGASWKVGIQHPRRADAYVAVARLDGRCLATSGDYSTAFDEGRHSHHIFDPATGRSPAAFSSVSVVAATAMEADALSTAVFVLGLERGVKLVAETDRADALFVLKDGSVRATAGFPRVA